MFKALRDTIRRIWAVSREEAHEYLRQPLMVFCLLVAPSLTVVFFTTLMKDGLPTDLPVAVVDEDDTQVTRTFIRTVDALQQTDIVARYRTFTEARESMQRGDIYAVFYLPKGITEEAIAGRQPQISFYTNECYYIPSALVMKDLFLASELFGLALTRETLYARGLTNERAMGIIQPIVIEKHATGNPWLNYSVLLSNVILPGILMILVMLCSCYLIGMRWKRGEQEQLYHRAGDSQTVALMGVLLPVTVCFSLIIIVTDIYLYRVLEFPCHCPVGMMMLWGILGILASQSLAVFVYGLLAGQMRFALSVCSLIGIVSISMAGFSFPVSAMHPVLQALSNVFPLRHYFLIYANQALNGYPVAYAWGSVVALLSFLLLPLLVVRRYRWAFLHANYVP